MLPPLLLIGITTMAAGPCTAQVVQRASEVDHDSTSSGNTAVQHHPSRALTAALAVTLGPFGAHRLYLGTKPKVPLIYGLTFGGFGVLVVIDLAHVLFTKDLGVYQENDQVLMWAKPRKEHAIPP